MNFVSERYIVSGQNRERLIIEDVSLSVKASEVIRDMIIRGECPMGSRVLEADFATALGVSRSIIRESFMNLENDGLLVRNTNRSTVVKLFTRKDVESIYHLRTAIEAMCLEVGMAAGLYSDMELNIKSNTIDRSFHRDSQAMEWMKNDMVFHEYLVAASENTYACKVWRSLKSQILTVLWRAYKLKPDILVPLGEAGGHSHIVECVMNGDTLRAVKQLKQHIQDGLEVILETYDCESSGG